MLVSRDTLKDALREGLTHVDSFDLEERLERGIAANQVVDIVASSRRRAEHTNCFVEGVYNLGVESDIPYLGAISYERANARCGRIGDKVVILFDGF